MPPPPRPPAYGRTWWGSQWLQSLAETDFDNRLPRGRAYAGRGAVRDLVVKDNHIRARVQGSRPQPYEVTLEVPLAPAAGAQRLAQGLAKDPGLIARLLNRELDPAVLKAAEALKLQIFPRRWSDLKMHCSCPDWAVPCKHLAAVIYLLSQEIDGDPFLVFRLRGIDLAALLAPHGLATPAEARPAPPAGVLQLFAEAPAPGEPAGALDFTALPDLHESLWRLLPARPTFWRGGDFHGLAAQALARVAREARRELEVPPVAATPLPQGQPQFLVDETGVLHASGCTLAGRPLATTACWLSLLTCMAPARLDDLPPAFGHLRTAHLLALHLLAQGAVAPQVFAAGGRTLGLRWCAAELDPTVRRMVDTLAATLPPGLLQGTPAGKRSRKPSPVPAAAQARLLLSALIDARMRSWAGTHGRADRAARGLHDGKVHALFFGSGIAEFDGPGEGALAGSIQTWLARLQLGAQPHRPVLQLEEAPGGRGFALSLAVLDERSRPDRPTPLATVMTKAAWAPHRLAVLKTVAMLADFHAPLHDYVRQGARRPLVMDAQALPALLFDALPALRLMGVRTVLPRALQQLWRPRASLQIKAAGSRLPSVLNADTLLSFDWQVAVGDERLSAAEFERLLGRADGIVAFRGHYVMLDAAQVAALRMQLSRPPALSGADLLRAALAGEHEGAPVGLNKTAALLVQRLQQEDPVPLPTGLRASLRPYQRRGYAWLWRNTRLGLGSVIADDMGLGKTLQVLALLLRLKQDGALDDARALVIVPTSLLSNWQQEAARFAPALSVGVFHGSRRELAQARPDMLLTTYGVARSEAARLKQLAWRVLVIDEAQNIKNPGAAQTRAVKSIPAVTQLAMSGTPVENRLSEYWSIMDFAQRGHLGGLAHFTREFATPIQTHRDAAAAERLRKVMAPFLLRRLKSDKAIIGDLPAKLQQDQHCTLTREQAALYEAVVREGLRAVQGESRSIQRQGRVLQMILALKQICNHPAQYLKQGAADPAASGKSQRLLDLLDEIESAQGKALVFTQFREMGDLLVQMLRARPSQASVGREVLFLHGGLPRARRDDMVQRFQQDPGERVFLLSLKAGGTGLNLTAANHVIHFDLWWNPAVEAQATDRAYRIGQQRAVQVHRFITLGTFEERINAMIQGKRELAEMTVGTGETWIGQLPPDELQALFQLR